MYAVNVARSFLFFLKLVVKLYIYKPNTCVFLVSFTLRLMIFSLIVLIYYAQQQMLRTPVTTRSPTITTSPRALTLPLLVPVLVVEVVVVVEIRRMVVVRHT